MGPRNVQFKEGIFCTIYGSTGYFDFYLLQAFDFYLLQARKYPFAKNYLLFIDFF